jgi:hypothetical protein
VGQYGSSSKRPAWTNNGRQTKDLFNSYIEVASGSGYSESEARTNAVKVIFERRSGATGMSINVQMQGKDITVTGSDNLTVKTHVLDEHLELSDGRYRVYLWVQTAVNPSVDIERVEISRDYPFTPAVFVPGMAQIHKGSTGKGITFIAGEMVMIGGIILSESLRASNASKINNTHNNKQEYIDNADSWQNIRNGFIGGAVALYAWNIIDGIAAKGEKHAVVWGDANLKITPYAAPNAGGFVLTLNF